MDPYLGPCFPLVVWLCISGSCLQNKDRDSKRNPVLEVDLNIGSRKELAGSSPLCVLHVGSVVDAVVCMSDSTGPHMCFNCLGPHLVSMEELCLGYLLWLSYPSVSLAVGVMGTHCSKGEPLAYVVAGFHLGPCLKDPIVCMVAFDDCSH